MKALFVPALLATALLAAQNAPKPPTREELAKTFRAKALDPSTLKKEADTAGGCTISRHSSATEIMRGTSARAGSVHDNRVEWSSITGGGPSTGGPGENSHLAGPGPRSVGMTGVDDAVLDKGDWTPRFFEPGERVSVAAFKFTKEDGSSQSIGDLKGRVTLLFLFRGDCRRTYDMMGELLRLHGVEDKAGIRVIAVSIVNPGWTPVKQFRKLVGAGLPAAFPIYLPSGESASGLDALGELKAAPTTFILDRQGRIAWRINGATPGSLADKLNMIRMEL